MKKQKQIDEHKSNKITRGYTSFGRSSPLAQRLRTTLVYNEVVGGGNNVLGQTDYVWNLNSLFDPNYTGTGHQPRGFDQLAALYERYRVYAVRYNVRVWLNTGYNGSPTVPHVLVVVPTNSQSAFSSTVDAQEQPFAKSIGYNSYYSGTINGVVDLAKLNGKTQIAYAADDTTQAQTNASPSEILTLHTMVANFSATNVQSYIEVTFSFDCEFSDPVQLASS